MSLIQLSDVTLSFGVDPILDSVDFHLDKGERVCLVGRNGQGKSSLMRILTGELAADSGQVKSKPDLRIATLPQDVPQDIEGRVVDVVSTGLEHVLQLRERHGQVLELLAHDSSEARLTELDYLQTELDHWNGWDIEHQLHAHLDRFNVPADERFEALSGGMKRRVLLARSLLSKPHLLLLDEPTNHLDVDAITWLESFLNGFPGAVLFVTHDRMFLRSLATRIVDLDRGQLTSWPGCFDKYQEQKAAALEAESREWSRFDKKLSDEEVWIRQGIKARRTRNEGRVRALERLRAERSDRRERVGSVKMTIQDARLSGREVLTAENVSFAWDTQPILSDFSIRIMRGDRIGIIGPNGCGKTTLLKVLLGEIQPSTGSVRLGTKLEVVYFDQLRQQLQLDKTVKDNVSDGLDFIDIQGRRRHVIGYLQDFLFSPQRSRSPVSALSGGERNRLLLARLFTREANVLVMDEPTNDLDAETLELLEQTLLNFSGTILLVSHDREFLNNVVQSTIAFDADGIARTYVGGYSDWLRQRPQMRTEVMKKTKRAEPLPTAQNPKKLSFKERKELEALPLEIEELEEIQETLQRKFSDPNLYRDAPEEVANIQAELRDTEARLGKLYDRWEILEDIEAQN